MKTANNETEKKRLTMADVFFIACVILLLAAIVGQDVAVYLINRSDRSQRFRIGFTIPSVKSEKAAEMKDGRPLSSETEVLLENKVLGTINTAGEVYGGFMIDEGGAEGGYVRMTGTMDSEGKITDGKCRIYGFSDDIAVGDKKYVVFAPVGGADGSFAPCGYVIEITSIELIPSN